MFTGGVQPAQDELSEGGGKVPRSSWAARCSRQLHVYVRLLTQCGREADLRCVVSSYSARGCRVRSDEGRLGRQV